MKANFWITKEREKESGIIRLTYPNKKVYQGSFKNEKPDGKGVLYHNDGSVVKGVWKSGKIETVE